MRAVAEEALRCCAQLLFSNVENRRRLAAAGVAEAIVDVLQIRGIHNPAVSGAGLRAIANLAFDDENRARLGNSSVSTVIVHLLEKHGLTNPFVAVAGMRAIASLLYNNDIINAKLGDANACSTVVTLVRRHAPNDTSFAEDGLSAIANLSINEENRIRLGKARWVVSTCPLLSALLTVFLLWPALENYSTDINNIYVFPF